MRFLVAIVGALLLGACGGQSSDSVPELLADPERPTKVVVTLPPLAWAVDALALNGVNAEVHILLPAGASPHGWEPSPSDALALAEADIVLVAGKEDRAKIQPLMGDSDAPVISMQDAQREGETADEHPWLSKAIMLRFVHSLYEPFDTRGIPDHPDPRSWPRLSWRNPDALVLTSHDAWASFFDKTGAEVVAVHGHHHHEASAAHLASIRDRAIAAERVLVVLEPGHDDPWLRDLADEVGAATVTLDPVGTRDWPGDMKKRYEAVEAALESLE